MPSRRDPFSHIARTLRAPTRRPDGPDVRREDTGPGAPGEEIRSAIKPTLLNVSTSGSLLTGAIAERDRERAGHDVDGAAVKAARHLVVVHQGPRARLDWRHDGRPRRAVFSPGQAIVNPLGLFVAPRWHSDVELLLVGLDPGLVQRVGEEMGRQHVELIPRVRTDDRVLEALVSGLVAEMERDTPPDRVYAQSLTYAIAAHLVRHHSVSGMRPDGFRGGLPPAALARVVEYMRAHVGDNVTVEDLARVAGFGPSHFTTLFRRATGAAPYRYLMEQRIEKARSLLSDTRLSIAEVAATTGFADQSHLTRVLKRQTGLTPRELRRQHPGFRSRA